MSANSVVVPASSLSDVLGALADSVAALQQHVTLFEMIGAGSKSGDHQSVDLAGAGIAVSERCIGKASRAADLVRGLIALESRPAAIRDPRFGAGADPIPVQSATGAEPIFAVIEGVAAVDVLTFTGCALESVRGALDAGVQDGIGSKACFALAQMVRQVEAALHAVGAVE